MHDSITSIMPTHRAVVAQPNPAATVRPPCRDHARPTGLGVRSEEAPLADPSLESLKRVRVFIASPGDLFSERTQFPKILEKANCLKAKSSGILLEPVGWEDTLPGMGRPQEKINADLATSDLVVMLLWKRWGTPTGKYSSGFEEEYHLARELKKEIWLYVRSVPDAMLVDPGDQLKKVLQFRNQIESERELLYKRYEDDSAWLDLLLEHLCRWLDGLKPTLPAPGPPPDYAAQKAALQADIDRLRQRHATLADYLARDAWELANTGHLTKAEEHFARAAELSPEPHIILGYNAFLQRLGELAKAEAQLTTLIEITEATGDKPSLSATLNHLGILHQIRGDLDQADKMYRKSLAIEEELGSKEGMAADYANLGTLYRIRGDLVGAEEMYGKSLAINEELGSKEGMASNYGNLGIVYGIRGDLDRAEEMYRKSLALFTALGATPGIQHAQRLLDDLKNPSDPAP